MGRTGGMGGHQSAVMGRDEWITPRWVLDEFGPFDLDPCAAVGQPWSTAAVQLTRREDGLSRGWSGHVWLNPPYGRETGHWLSRLADHGDGLALIFARTETAMFSRCVWARATAVLFLAGRLFFHHVDGRRAGHNCGAPSVLVAYGERAAGKLLGRADAWVAAAIRLGV